MQETHTAEVSVTNAKDLGDYILSIKYYRLILVIDFSYFGGAESLSEGRSPRRVVPSTPTKNDDGVSHIRPPQDPNDFLWLMTEEPHRSRRAAIMKAHPEARTFMQLTLLVYLTM